MYWECCSCNHKMVDSPYFGCTKWPPHNQPSTVQRCCEGESLFNTFQHNRCMQISNFGTNKLCCFSAVWNRTDKRQVLSSSAVKVCFTLHKSQLYFLWIPLCFVCFFVNQSWYFLHVLYYLTAAAHLNVHFDDCFPNECCTKKSPEGDQKMSTCYTCKVKQGIWNLGKNNRDD